MTCAQSPRWASREQSWARRSTAALLTWRRPFKHLKGRAMLTKRIIPCLDVTDGRVVKGVNFVNLRDAGDPVELAALYNAEGADELVFLDITASVDNLATMLHDVCSQTVTVCM